MELPSDTQLQKEELEIRERDARRQREKAERMRKQAEAEAEAERKRVEEQQRRLEEERRRQRQREEEKRLGSDVIVPLPPLPPPARDGLAGVLDAWRLDEPTSQPALSTLSLKPGKLAGSAPVTLKELRDLGVVLYLVNLNDLTLVKQFINERNYKHTDEIRVSQTAKDDVFLERWYQEHYNEDEQARLVLDGSCYVDVRSKQDTWLRLHLRAGHMLVLPAGMYHRTTLDEDDYVGLFRLFCDAPRFAPVFRADNRADSRKVRLAYLMNLKKGDVATALGFRY